LKWIRYEGVSLHDIKNLRSINFGRARLYHIDFSALCKIWLEFRLVMLHALAKACWCSAWWRSWVWL